MWLRSCCVPLWYFWPDAGRQSKQPPHWNLLRNLHWVYNFNLGQPKGRQITFSQAGEILDSSVK